MKTITLNQYVQVCRTVALDVPDDCSEKEAAEALDDMPLCFDANDALSKMPANASVVSDWDYVSDMGIENLDGEVVYDGCQ